MDATQLAKMMLEWEALQRRADELREAIEDCVLQIGKTQTVGNVRASFSAGRKRYDYKTPGQTAQPSVIELHTKRVTDWRAVCNDERSDVGDIPFAQGEPSVSVKLLK